jgi:hypothetical protein
VHHWFLRALGTLDNAEFGEVMQCGERVSEPPGSASCLNTSPTHRGMMSSLLLPASPQKRQVRGVESPLYHRSPTRRRRSAAMRSSLVGYMDWALRASLGQAGSSARVVGGTDRDVRFVLHIGGKVVVGTWGGGGLTTEGTCSYLKENGGQLYSGLPRNPSSDCFYTLTISKRTHKRDHRTEECYA